MQDQIARRLPLVGVLAFLISTLTSCGMGSLGTGVVLWSDSEQLTNGALVWIWDQSRITKSVIAQRTDGGSRFEISAWRVRIFHNEADARTFRKDFSHWQNVWANVQKGGLLVRAKPDPTALKVYRLSQDEELKILGQMPDAVTLDGLNGHWDEVLTQNGSTGWCFDYYLSLYRVDGNKKNQMKQGGPGDFYLRAVESNPWYPEEFRNEVDQNRVNLSYFQPSYVFRYNGTSAFDLTIPPQPQNSEAAQSFHFTFSEVRKLDTASFLFVGPESLSVRVLNPEATRIEISFLQNDQPSKLLYSRLDQDIGTYIAQESASRLDKLNALLAQGKTLVSPTWGRMSLVTDGSFTWTGLQSLQPPEGILFPPDLTGAGQLKFDWFKDIHFVGDWHVMRMVLARSDNPTNFSQLFLYRYLKGGIQLLPVSPADTNPSQQTILRESHLDYTLFLTFQN